MLIMIALCSSTPVNSLLVNWQPWGLLRAAWLRPKQTDLVPGKGQFRSRFPHPLRYCCPTTIFLDPQPTPTSSQLRDNRRMTDAGS